MASRSPLRREHKAETPIASLTTNHTAQSSPARQIRSRPPAPAPSVTAAMPTPAAAPHSPDRPPAHGGTPQRMDTDRAAARGLIPPHEAPRLAMRPATPHWPRPCDSERGEYG